MELNIQFNCIYIIQSLPKQETQTGSKLIEDIKVRTLRFEYLKTKLIDVSSSADLHKAFYDLNEAFFNEGVVPYLHFEIHGSKEGLVLKNGELIPWEHLRPSLSAINYNIENNLFVSLATCYGAYLFSAVDMLERIPFIGFVGPAHEISTGDVQKDWGAYFDTLLSDRDFYTAISALNLSNPRVPYTFFTAEQIFDRYTKAYLKGFETKKGRRQRFLSLKERARRDFPHLKNFYTKEQLNAYFRNYVSNQGKLIADIKDYFMMRTDKLPFQ